MASSRSAASRGLLTVLLLAAIFSQSLADSLFGPHPKVHLKRAKTTRPLSRPKGLVSALQTGSSSANYTTIFEITKPLFSPGKQCLVRVLNNQPFIDTKPFNTKYTPPKGCVVPWSKVILTFSGTANDYQLDRLVDVYFSGVRIVSSSTPDGLPLGSKWSFDLDVTRFSPLLRLPRDVTINLPNSVNLDITLGIYNLTISLKFYQGTKAAIFPDLNVPVSSGKSGVTSFLIRNRTRTATATLTNLPRNPYRAQLEIRATSTGSDQLSYYLFPQQYAKGLNLSEENSLTVGNPFQELLVRVDGVLAGKVVPRPIFYPTGPFYKAWVPLVGIGTFLAPSYFVEVTPFVAKLADGKPHTISLSVPGVSVGSTWVTDATLHLWLAKGTKQTKGRYISTRGAALTPTSSVQISKDKIDLNFTTSAFGAIVTTGIVQTASGKFTSTVITKVGFQHAIKVAQALTVVDVVQRKSVSTSVVMRSTSGALLYAYNDVISSPLSFTTEVFFFDDGTDDSQQYFAHSTAVNSKQSVFLRGFGNSSESVSNSQNGFGNGDTTGYYLHTINQHYNSLDSNLGCYVRAYREGYSGVLQDDESFFC